MTTIQLPDPDTVARLANRFPTLLRKQDSPLPCTTRPTLFDADSGTVGGGRAIVPARALCQQCPLIVACAAYACHKRERGIWGGTTSHERGLAGYPPKPHHELNDSRRRRRRAN
ncbi:WhiB family transcriptional regulator [Streptomyces sp. NPDC019396]|uniref:WhiB family transcriptional regulator n=1 Tax=Streptomyces sp. NPDC019396 TaxID=3154687 RepID=UPI0033E8E4BC